MIKKCDCPVVDWRPHTRIEQIECVHAALGVPVDRERWRRRARALLIVVILFLWAAALVTYVIGSR